MKTYEVRLYFKKYDKTIIVTATAIIIDGNIIEIADYATATTLFYNKDDVKVEYIKEN